MKQRILLTLLALLPLVVQGQKSFTEDPSAASSSQVRTYTPQDSLMAYLQHAMLFPRATPPEKVYLHLDNTGYFKGERIWMKAYVTQARPNRIGAATYVPSTISRVLYVELLNPTGDVVARRKLSVENGEAHGDILLDSIFGTGFYELRAFTRYMRNWGDGQEFSRIIPIFNRPEHEGDYSHPTIDLTSRRHRLPNMRSKVGEGDIAGTTQQGKSNLTLRFFPEGGDLVVGLKSRVAYTVGSTDSGEIERGITELTPTSTTPQPFTYTDSKGQKHQVNLPAAQAEGCVLRLDALDEEAINWQLSSSSAMQGRLLAYALLHNGSVVQCDTFTAEPILTRSFRRLDLPAGVNQLTIFDSQGRIRAERLFFVCPTVGLGLDTVAVTADVQALQPCAPVTLTLQTRPEASMSFSAMDVASLTGGKQGSIATWMLLSSDLRGYIENPEYYFEADDEEHRRAADLLMMVQGWRRYDWQLISGVRPFPRPVQPIEDRLYIIGDLKPSLSAWKKKNTVAGVDLTAILYNRAGDHLSGATTTDSTGHYAFQLPDIDGDWSLQIQTRLDDKLKSYTVGIDRHFSPSARYIAPEESQMLEKNEPNLFRLPQQVKQAATDGSDGSAADFHGQYRFQIGDHQYVTQTVKIKGKRRHYWTDYTSGWYNEKNAARRAAIYYDCDAASDEIADRGEVQPSVYEWLQQKNEFFHDGELNMENADTFLAGVTRCSYAADTSATWNRHVDGPSYKNRPTIWILNNKYAAATHIGRGIDSGDIIFKQNIEHMPMFLNEVKSVYITEEANVLESYCQWSDVLGNNPVIVFLYTHPTYTTSSNKGLRRTHFEGYNKPSTFEMEDYSELPPMDDFRRTIFWAPSVKADSDGRATVKFFNNSTARELLLSIEGITPDGTPVAK